MAKAEISEEIVITPELELDGVIPEVPVDDAVIDGSEEPVVATPVVDENAELKKQLDAANRRAEEAESRANSLSQEKTVSETRLATEVNTRFAAQEQAIDARASAAKAAIISAKQEMVRAQAEGRFEDYANAAEQLADAKAEERESAGQKNMLASYKERAKAELEAQNTRSTDPTEAFLAAIPGEASKRWLRDHPDILRKASTSQREQKALFGAAQLAEGRGITPDSAEYFEFIEEQLGLKEPAPVVTQTPKPAPKPPGQTASAAPSGRSAAPSSTTRTVTLDDVVRKLTPNDRANAKISFPDKTPEDAAKLYAQGIVLTKQREPGFRPDIRL